MSSVGELNVVVVVVIVILHHWAFPPEEEAEEEAVWKAMYLRVVAATVIADGSNSDGEYDDLHCG